MWLSRQLTEREPGVRLISGQVSYRAAVRDENETHQAETLFPYGFSSVAAQGGKAVLVDGYCAGVSALPDSGLAQGEVRLFSQGGAEILLKNDGSVVINGQSIAAR